MDHAMWAKELLAALVGHIRNFNGGHKYITYGSLAGQVGYPAPHTGNLFGSNIGKTLGVMGHMFDNVVIDGEKVPLIQALVVSQGKKLPSDGLKEFNKTYPQLSDEKKKDFVATEYQKIFQFGDRWEKVLEELGIQIPFSPRLPGNSGNKCLYNPYGGEGSPEHIALRDYISRNPLVVGLPAGTTGITEYPLKSGDYIDVAFETEDSVLGVEVKSRRSGNDDHERGLYQCIKYSAVLAAESNAGGTGKKTSCVLVLEGELSSRLRRVQRDLDVQVYEKIISPKVWV